MITYSVNENKSIEIVRVNMKLSGENKIATVCYNVTNDIGNVVTKTIQLETDDFKTFWTDFVSYAYLENLVASKERPEIEKTVVTKTEEEFLGEVKKKPIEIAPIEEVTK